MIFSSSSIDDILIIFQVINIVIHRQKSIGTTKTCERGFSGGTRRDSRFHAKDLHSRSMGKVEQEIIFINVCPLVTDLFNTNRLCFLSYFIHNVINMD